MANDHPTEERIDLDALNNGGWPAHPTQALDGSGMPISEHCPGLSKRELLAAMAMQGWLAGCENAYNEFTGPATYAETAAKACVTFADALLKELAK